MREEISGCLMEIAGSGQTLKNIQRRSKTPFSAHQTSWPPEPANGFNFDQHWTSSIDTDADIRGPCILILYALEWGMSKSLDVDFHLIQPRTTGLPKLML